MDFILKDIKEEDRIEYCGLLVHYKSVFSITEQGSPYEKSFKHRGMMKL